jgi:hypothetical protein
MVNLIMGEMFAAQDAPHAAMARQKSGVSTFTKSGGAETAHLSRGAHVALVNHS